MKFPIFNLDNGHPVNAKFTENGLLCFKNKVLPSYMGKHLAPRGGVILKRLEGFRGGTQRVGLSKGGI